MVRREDDQQESTLVLISPIGNDADCWQFLDLPRARTIEYPGHGQRERQPGWTQQTFADEVVAAFDGPLDLVGLSMGGTVVAQIIHRHRERVRSALIACGGGIARAALTDDERVASRNKALARGERGLREGMEAVVSQTLRRWYTPYALSIDHPGPAYSRRTLTNMDPEAWSDVWKSRAYSDPIPVEALERFDLPITLLAGMHDWAAGLRGLSDAHNLLKCSRFEIMSGPHMMHLERPENLMAALSRHLCWVPNAQRVERPLISTGLSSLSVETR